MQQMHFQAKCRKVGFIDSFTVVVGNSRGGVVMSLFGKLGVGVKKLTRYCYRDP